MKFNRLRMKNFKRFAGNHSIPLSGDGTVTVIAAENGVGKTTILDAFFLCLHGKKGMKLRKKKTAFQFEDWLANAFSSQATAAGGTQRWLSGVGRGALGLGEGDARDPHDLQQSRATSSSQGRHAAATRVHGAARRTGQRALHL